MMITVNGRRFVVRGASLSYDDIARLAREPEPTVTFHTKGGASGSLTRGDVIALSDGLVIHAVRTSGA